MARSRTTGASVLGDSDRQSTLLLPVKTYGKDVHKQMDRFPTKPISNRHSFTPVSPDLLNPKGKDVHKWIDRFSTRLINN